MCSCSLWISAKDSHPLCTPCLGVKHAQAAISNPDGCSIFSGFPIKTRERRLRVAIAGNQDPCFSSQSQPRGETAKQTQEPSTWGDIMDVQAPDLPPSLVMPSRPPSNQSGDLHSSPAVELNLTNCPSTGPLSRWVKGQRGISTMVRDYHHALHRLDSSSWLSRHAWQR